MKSNRTNTHIQTVAIAALSNLQGIQSHDGEPVAVLTFDSAQLDINNTSRVQLLPDGKFAATDGRPFEVPGGKWLMDALAFSNLQANAATRSNDFHFDYEHQTLNSDMNGKPAPAAGWFSELEYVPGEGLFALNVDWTTAANQFIANKEYRYTSAVFSYDAQSGRPLALLHVALTNDPALDGMKAIAALKACAHSNSTNPAHSLTTSQSTKGNKPMTEALKLLLGLLGIDEPGDLSDTAALKTATDTAKTAIAALKTKADKSGTLETELNTAQASVAALKNASGEVDLSKYVPKATYDAQVTAMAALKAGSDKDSVEQLLKDNADKVLEAETDYLTSFGKQQGVAALKAMLEARPAIAALKNTQTQGKKKPGENGEQLSTEQLAVCKNMGLTVDEFKASLSTTQD
ncbi:phage protease [Shewanella eurypsychrophilus]|uniref:Phage protease n=1 Tax=Shewanella eurypsychrophilus TaxID=2593656 RepID=A0ABX6VAP2_9GAMM|nr:MULTISPECIES: phage protease [Shewanella]QFU23734.1 phage scaffold protein [Shewanella sp. YLB-09]QPG58954.1 phage protease [Shewanella eurypsychrophilus]